MMRGFGITQEIRRESLDHFSEEESLQATQSNSEQKPDDIDTSRLAAQMGPCVQASLIDSCAGALRMSIRFLARAITWKSQLHLDHNMAVMAKDWAKSRL